MYKLANKEVRQEQEETKIVEAVRVKKGQIRATATIIGTIATHHQTNLKAKANGILKTNVEAGAHVHKNDLIAQIDTLDARQNYRIAEQTKTIASEQLKRLEQLLKSKHITKSSFEEKKAHLLEQQRKVLEAKKGVDNSNISAPFDGIIGLYKFQSNANVQEGDIINYLYDPGAIYIQINLPSNLAGKINDNTKVIFKEKEYKIKHVQKIIDEKTHMYPAEIDVVCDNCAIGSSAKISLILFEKEDVIIIPEEAVFLKEGKTSVYLVKDSKATLTTVKLGIRDKSCQEITEGLVENDLIVSKGANRLYDGALVRVLK